MTDDIRIQVRVLRGPRAGEETTEQITFPKTGHIVVGRGPQADLQLAHPTISTTHMAVHKAKGLFWVEDLGSQNGTMHGATQLTPHNKTPCAPGDLLFLGPFVLSILDPSLDQPLGQAGSTQSLALEAVLKILQQTPSDTALLTIVSGPQQGTTIPLPLGRPLLIGTDPGCHIALSDPNISHKHARIYADAEGVWLEDLHSAHGTFVDGHRIFGLWKLATRQNIQIGAVVIEFHDPTEQLLYDLEAAADQILAPVGAPLSDPPPPNQQTATDQPPSPPIGHDNQPQAQSLADLGPGDVPTPMERPDGLAGPNSDPRLASLEKVLPQGAMQAPRPAPPASSDLADEQPDGLGLSSWWWIGGLVGGIAVIVAASAMLLWLLSR